MHRIRVDHEGTPVEERIRFEPLQFGNDEDAHYRIEIKVRTLEEVQRYFGRNALVGLRMIGHPEGRAPQRSIIGSQHIHGLGLPAEVDAD